MSDKYNLRVIPKYTPVWVCNRDASHRCILLPEDTEVDDQTINDMDDDSVISRDSDRTVHILDEYWNWPHPLLICGPEGPNMIVSKHGLAYRDKLKETIQSLIVPAPYPMVAISGSMQRLQYKYTIMRVEQGMPVIIIPDVLRDESDWSSINYYADVDIFNRDKYIGNAHGILIPSYDAYLNEENKIYKSTPGSMLLYINKENVEILDSAGYFARDKSQVQTICKTRYSLSVKPNKDTVDHIWLYGTDIVFKHTDSLGELLYYLYPYMRTRFLSMPQSYCDIVISH